MIDIPDLLFVIVFCIVLLGLVVAAILAFVNKANPLQSRLLAAFIVSISIVATNNELMASSFFLHFPHLWRVVVFASFCSPVFCLLYFKAVIGQWCKIEKKYLLLFLPALLYTMSLLPFYLLPASKKILIIASIINNNSLIAREPEGMLPPGWGILSRMVFGISCVAAQFVVLAKWKHRMQDYGKSGRQNNDTYNWLFWFSVISVAMYAIVLFIIVFQLTTSINIWRALVIILAAIICFISLYLLVKPNILYGITGWVVYESAGTQEQVNYGADATANTHTATRKYALSIEQQLSYKRAIEKHFTVNQPFLKRGYKISDLAEELTIPSYQLSIFINHEYSKNFSELINDYRIKFLEELFHTDSGVYSKYTFEALSKKAGFNSRNAFISAVKKKSGKTPSAYFGIREAVAAT